MAKLTFDIAQVAALVAHAQSATTHRLSFADQMNPAYAVDGAKPDESGLYEYESIDQSKVKPSLQLVHDDGIYLMSSGSPMMDKETRCAYAKGYNPGKDGDVWDKCRAAVGGDDFVESLPITDFVKILAVPGLHSLFISVTGSRISIGYTYRSPRAKQAA